MSSTWDGLTAEEREFLLTRFNLPDKLVVTDGFTTAVERPVWELRQGEKKVVLDALATIYKTTFSTFDGKSLISNENPSVLIRYANGAAAAAPPVQGGFNSQTGVIDSNGPSFNVNFDPTLFKNSTIRDRHLFPL